MAKAKGKIYKLMYQMWKANCVYANKIVYNNISNPPVYIVMVFLEAIQFEYFIFYYFNLILANNSIANTITQTLYYLSLGFCSDINATIAIVVFALLVAYSVFTIIVLIFVTKKSKKKFHSIFEKRKKQFRSSLMYKLLSIFYVIVLPIVEYGLFKLAISTFHCTTYQANNDNSACFTGKHIAMIALAVLLLLYYIIRITFVQIMINDYNPNTSIPTASIMPYFPEQIFKLNKIIGCIVVILDKEKTMFALMMIINFLLNIGVVLMGVVFPPLFHDSVTIIRVLVHSHLAMFSLIVFLLDWLGIYLNTSLMLMSFFVSLFLGYIALKIRNYLIKNKLKLLFKFDKNAKSCQQKKYLFSYIFPKITDLEKNIQNQVEIEGIIKEHVINCNVTDCFCHRTTKKYSIKFFSTHHLKSFNEADEEEDSISESENSDIRLNKKDAIHFFHYYAIYLTEIYESDPLITMFLSYFQYTFFKTKKILSAIYNATKFMKVPSTSNTMNIAIKLYLAKLYYVFKKYYLMRNLMNDKEKSKILKIRSIIQVENYRSQLIEGISDLSKHVFNFWMGLLKLDINGIDLLLSASDKLNDSYDSLENIINESAKQCPKSYKIMKLIAGYYADIANNVENSNKYKSILEDEIKKREYDKDMLHILPTNENAAIVVSGSSQNLGTVLYASKDMVLFSGYTITELVGHNLEILVPQFIEQAHRNIMKDFINESKEGFTEPYIILRTKQQYLSLIDVTIVPLFNLSIGITFIVIVYSSECPKQLTKHYSLGDTYMLFIANESNKLIGFNESFGKKFELSPTEKNEEKEYSVPYILNDDDMTKYNEVFSKTLESNFSDQNQTIQVLIIPKEVKYLGFTLKIVHLVTSETKSKVNSVLQSDMPQESINNDGNSKLSINESSMQINIFEKHESKAIQGTTNLKYEKYLKIINFVMTSIFLFLYFLLLFMFQSDIDNVKNGCKTVAVLEKLEYNSILIGLTQLAQIMHSRSPSLFLPTYSYDTIKNLGTLLNIKQSDSHSELFFKNDFNNEYFAKYNNYSFYMMQVNKDTHILINQSYNLFYFQIASICLRLNKLSFLDLCSALSSSTIRTDLFSSQNDINYFVHNHFQYFQNTSKYLFHTIKTELISNFQSFKVSYIVILCITVVLSVLCMIFIIRITQKTFLMKAELFNECIQYTKNVIIDILQRASKFRKDEYLVDDDVDNDDLQNSIDNQGNRNDTEDASQKLEKISYQLTVASKGKIIFISLILLLAMLVFNIYMITDYVLICGAITSSVGIMGSIESINVYFSDTISIGCAMILNKFFNAFLIEDVREIITELYNNIVVMDNLRNNRLTLPGNITDIMLTLDSTSYCSTWVQMIKDLSNSTDNWYLNSFNESDCNNSYKSLASMGISHVISSQYQEYEILSRSIDDTVDKELVYLMQMEIMINTPILRVFEMIIETTDDLFVKEKTLNIALFASQIMLNIVILITLYRLLIKYLRSEIKKMDGINKISVKKDALKLKEE